MTYCDSSRPITLVLCLVLAACGYPERPKPDTAAIMLEESRDALASRLECQEALDAARTALVRKDVDRCVTSLAQAAAFLRTEAIAAPPEARTALVAAADEFEMLLANVAKNRARTSRDFDRVAARAHTAETGLHLSRAREALLKDDDVRAGQEYFMASDHLERAAKDARLRADPVVQVAIADTRSLATEMMNGMAVVPDEALKATQEIQAAIRRIDASVYVPHVPESWIRYD